MCLTKDLLFQKTGGVAVRNMIKRMERKDYTGFDKAVVYFGLIQIFNLFMISIEVHIFASYFNMILGAIYNAIIPCHFILNISIQNWTRVSIGKHVR